MKKTILIIMLFLTPFFVFGNCIDLEDESTWQGKIQKWSENKYYTDKDITLCNKTYTHLTEGFYIGGTNKVFDCNGAKLIGNGSGLAFYVGRSAGINTPYFAKNRIKNCIIENYHTAVTLNLAKESVVENNVINNCKSGIKIIGAQGSLIINNQILNGKDFSGITLQKSTYGYKAKECTIKENYIEGFSQKGIFLKEAENNLITKNIIKNNAQQGIYLILSNNNSIYDNYFENIINAYLSSSSENIWHYEKIGINIIDNENIGGNYWSDYLGIDENCDGFGDNAYTNFGINDLMPLVKECIKPKEKISDLLTQEKNKDLINNEENEECNYLIEILKLKENSSLPSFLPYKNEIFNIYTLDNKIIGHVEIKNNLIISFGCNLKENPTYNVYIKDTKIIENILNADSSIDAFNKAKKRNLIKIEGTRVSKKIKQGFVNLGLLIVGFFK
jgi:parallel beta-helix repeat protein